MQKNQTKQLVICALLAGISALLSGPLSFYFGSWKISLGTLPIMLAGILYGPVYGGVTGGVGDIANVLLSPKGAYNPIFTVTAVIAGVLSGVLYRKKPKEARILNLLPVTASTQLVCSFFLNSLWMVIFYGATPMVFATKLLYNLVMIPVNTVLLLTILTLVMNKVNAY